MRYITERKVIVNMCELGAYTTKMTRRYTAGCLYFCIPARVLRTATRDKAFTFESSLYVKSLCFKRFKMDVIDISSTEDEIEEFTTTYATER